MSLTLRSARASDLEAMTAIAIAAFPFNPQWPYCFPYREEYPDEHYHHVRLSLQEYLARTAEKANEMMLVEAPDKDNPDLVKVVAYSIWDNPGTNKNGKGAWEWHEHTLCFDLTSVCSAAAVPPSKSYFDRRDGNASHMEAYTEAIMAFRQEVFVGRYGDRQMSLRQIATHPDYWRRGAGHLFIDWGVKKAIEAGVAIVLFASPMGKKLYETFGFRELGIVYVHSPGDKESLNICGMAWDEAAVKEVGHVLKSGDIPMDQDVLKG